MPRAKAAATSVGLYEEPDDVDELGDDDDDDGMVTASLDLSPKGFRQFEAKGLEATNCLKRTRTVGRFL